MMQKKLKENKLNLGTWGLSESYSMDLSMAGFRKYSKKTADLCVLVLWAKVASALEGLLAGSVYYTSKF